MSQPQRSTSVKEQFAQRGLLAVIPGTVAVLIGVPMVGYQSMFLVLGYVLMAMGLGAIVYGVSQFVKSKGVPDFPVQCPFCQHRNAFMEPAREDVRCEGCQRMIPIEDGRILHVSQVRCGFCNHLNYYSEKSTGLICESCNRVIPISTADGQPHAKKSFEQYTVHDDDRPFNLVLLGGDPKHEELVSCLQHALALNRNQVKDMFEALPVTLLTGIPKRKAEMLRAQIEMHGGEAAAQPS
jgi:ribosomal protein S27E